MDGWSEWAGQPAFGDSRGGPNDWRYLYAAIYSDAEWSDQWEHHWTSDRREVFDGHNSGVNGRAGGGVCLYRVDGWSEWSGESAGGDGDARSNNWRDVHASVQCDAECGNEWEYYWSGGGWKIPDRYDRGANGGASGWVCLYGVDGGGFGDEQSTQCFDQRG